MAEWAGTAIDKLFEDRTVPFLLSVVGLLLVAAGCFGGIQYQGIAPITELPWRIAAIGLGLTLSAAGALLWRTNSQTLNHKAVAKFGIEFTHPTAGDLVEQRCPSVRGKIRKRLPEGFSLWVVRIVRNGWYPSAEARINYTDNTWEARDVFVGNPTDAQWELAAYLVGNDGMAAIEHWQKNDEEYWTLLRKFRAYPGQENASPQVWPLRFGAFGVVQSKTIKVGKKL